MSDGDDEICYVLCEAMGWTHLEFDIPRVDGMWLKSGERSNGTSYCTSYSLPAINCSVRGVVKMYWYLATRHWEASLPYSLNR